MAYRTWLIFAGFCLLFTYWPFGLSLGLDPYMAHVFVAVLGTVAVEGALELWGRYRG